ncbi:unnamed protein product [marine sediment metagenome]|uniref:Uncharacterized protein n=1 Tax=marine sediment metagenome TaxID=412755 RepID=X1LHS5_9ZZZZ
MQLSEEDWDYVFGVNVKGTFLACQIFARQMIRQKSKGKIINISSIAGKIGLIDRAHYSASHLPLGLIFSFCALYQFKNRQADDRISRLSIEL